MRSWKPRLTPKTSCRNPELELLPVSLQGVKFKQFGRALDWFMTLAAILVVYLLSLGCSPGWVFGFAAKLPAQQMPPAQPSPAPTPQTPDSTTQPKPAPKPHHRKRATTSNCPAKPPAPDSAKDSAAPKPCPPPKVVVRNGGSPEPTVQLKGGTVEDASHQRSTTDQLVTVTEENLKKIDGHPLNPSQQEMVSQIKQFMEQSKAAVAAGDLERGRNLALKARLLSDELVKP